MSIVEAASAASNATVSEYRLFQSFYVETMNGHLLGGGEKKVRAPELDYLWRPTFFAATPY